MFTVCSRKFDVIAVKHDIATVQYSAHNLKVVGSNPTPATNLWAGTKVPALFFEGVERYGQPDYS